MRAVTLLPEYLSTSCEKLSLGSTEIILFANAATISILPSSGLILFTTDAFAIKLEPLTPIVPNNSSVSNSNNSWGYNSSCCHFKSKYNRLLSSYRYLTLNSSPRKTMSAALWTFSHARSSFLIYP